MDRAKEIIKKNMVSIICGVVALIAIVAVFWPISGMFADLQTRATTSAGMFGQLQNLLTKERHKPQVSLKADEPAEPLEHFPTETIIAEGNKVKAAIEKEAQAMYQAAVKLNQGDKKPLVPEAFPVPRNRAIENKFKQEYVKEMAYDSPDPARRAQSMPMREMNAGLKPTDAEIKAEVDRITKIISTNETRRDDKNRVLNQAEVQQKIADETAIVDDRMRLEAAKACRVYLDPGSLYVVESVTIPGRPLLPGDMFWAQITYWLQQDVCRAIKEANDGSSDVTNSTVKHLVKLNIPQPGFIQPSVAAPSGGEGLDDPSLAAPPVPTDPSQPIPPIYSISPTGRYSNPLYDVVQFELTLIADASRVPLILQALSKNRFITAYETDIVAEDSGAAQADGYIYGPLPVVRLNLKCEALFMREWTRQYMPPVVKRALGIVDPPPEMAP